ncbi:radical SAM protein [Pseudomonas sp. WS 5532]|uniref:radical SAM/SPASM domain-containing protein n=1 Tax=unclassified Pseudomonas TaxID=196821 RepID=UPI0014756B04|nr:MULTISPECIES: radical SAM protein [unclassified Pseudomonas]NMX71372.1 radical SAM protein [Pseudomonas sp. WS 5532]QXI60051.1 radical SAM protein [Pseudomonas sp. OE 28.3]
MIAPALEGNILSVILKLVGETCNLDCIYCYEKRRPYSGSRVLRVDSISNFLTGLDKQLAIELHGGEPLLYPESEFEKLSKLLIQLGSKVHSVRIQTNATLLDKEMISKLIGWFPRLQLGISFDGLDDTFRIDYEGKSATSLIEQSIRYTTELNIPIGIISVITSKNIKYPDQLVQHVSTFSNVKALKLVPCFDVSVTQGEGPKRRNITKNLIASSEGAQMPWSINPKDFSDFVIAAHGYWKEKGLFRSFNLEPGVSILKKQMGLIVNDCDYGIKKCGHVITIYPDGHVGTCDELASGESQKLPLTIADMQKTKTILENFLNRKDVNLLLEQCSTCSLFSLCGGGCIATRQRFLKAGRSREYCDARFQLFEGFNQ